MSTGQHLFDVLLGLGDDLAPRIHDVRAAPEVQVSLAAHSVHEDHEDLEHPGVEPGDVQPICLGVIVFWEAALSTGRGHEQDVRPVLGSQESQLGLPGVVADQDPLAVARSTDRTAYPPEPSPCRGPLG